MILLTLKTIWGKIKRHLNIESLYTLPLYHRIFMRRKVKKIRKKAKIKVLFISISPSMWKVDSLYRAMLKHSRFEVEILLAPNMTLSDEDARCRELMQLRAFFDKKEYHYVEWCNNNGKTKYDRIPKDYDILFYPQPWAGLIPHKLDFLQNKGRVMMSCLYAFHSVTQSWDYNKWYQQASWLDLYENELTIQEARKAKDNKGINSIITGIPVMDAFRMGKYTSPWKPQPTSCKKIIWAPHWTIRDKCSVLPSYSHFLEIAEYMLKFAQAHVAYYQFAFKPHPWLTRELYKHPDWGKKRTDEYYAQWEHGSNTQLELGEYIDLFMTSDAMIHDSCSFCCEYMYTGKPVLFIAKNEEKQVSLLNEMAKEAFYSQYIGHTLDDIESFIHDRVLNNLDPLKDTRRLFVDKYLTPPNKKAAAENIIDAILGAQSYA